MMGPGPPKKKGDKGSCKTASQRALTTAGPGSSYAPSTDASSPTVAEGSRISGEGWNFKRYQREDEALWGHDTQGPGQRIMDAIAKAGSTAGRLIESRLSRSGISAEEENPKSYYLAKNPPVNDLHPPVVSTSPASKDETRWMLQPPPSAKVMEGKEKVNRSRAGSNGSSRKGAPLSRQVTERLVDAKLQRGETFPELRSHTSRTGIPRVSSNRGQRHERDKSSEDSSESSGTIIKRKQKPPPISISTSGTSSKNSIEHIPIPSATGSEKERKDHPGRPALPTILSSTNDIPQVPSTTSDLPLREPSNSALNSRDPSPSTRLSPSANSMPAGIPRVESKFPGAKTFVFPQRHSTENSRVGE